MQEGKLKGIVGKGFCLKCWGTKIKILPFILSEMKSAGGDLRANFTDMWFKNTWKRELLFFFHKIVKLPDSPFISISFSFLYS